MDALNLTLLSHMIATSAMCGIIWFVQVVHYPLFRRVGVSRFSNYEAAHSRLTARVVVPLMLIEAITAIGLTAWLPAQPLAWLGLGVLALIWISTFVVQVPQHRRLAGGFDRSAHRRLVYSNWLRTIGWSMRVVIAAILSARAI
jgi:hypothetical protein